MTDFERWEEELGPEVTGIGKPYKELSDPELDVRMADVESAILETELGELSLGRTVEEVAAHSQFLAQEFGDGHD
jgi:NADPH-dependent curcumin reductase CurA